MQETRMFCPKCGKSISTSFIYCPRCGLNLEVIQDKFKENLEFKTATSLSANENQIETEKKTIDDKAVTPIFPQLKDDENKNAENISTESNTATGPQIVLDERNKFLFLGGIHHPWRRYFARTVDMILLGIGPIITCIFLIGFFFPAQRHAFTKLSENELISFIIVLTQWLLIEAILLSTAGTTPGKRIFHISIKTNEGDKLSFAQSLERTFLVLYQGMGLCIPFIFLFTNYFAYKRLTKTGTTLWDTEVKCVVSHKKWSALDAMICIVATLATFTILLM